MFSRAMLPWAMTFVALLVVGGALAAFLQQGPFWVGALLGGSVAVAAGVHLFVRSVAGRGVFASTPEAGEDSVERQVWVAASSAACADAVSVMLLVALLALWSPDEALLRWLPAAGLAVVLVDLGMRMLLGWRRRVGDGA